MTEREANEQTITQDAQNAEGRIKAGLEGEEATAKSSIDSKIKETQDETKTEIEGPMQSLKGDAEALQNAGLTQVLEGVHCNPNENPTDENLSTT